MHPIAIETLIHQHQADLHEQARWDRLARAARAARRTDTANGPRILRPALWRLARTVGSAPA
jgi:hypothetical protein